MLGVVQMADESGCLSRCVWKTLEHFLWYDTVAQTLEIG